MSTHASLRDVRSRLSASFNRMVAAQHSIGEFQKGAFLMDPQRVKAEGMALNAEASAASFQATLAIMESLLAILALMDGGNGSNKDLKTQ